MFSGCLMRLDRCRDVPAVGSELWLTGGGRAGVWAFRCRAGRAGCGERAVAEGLSGYLCKPFWLRQALG